MCLFAQCIRLANNVPAGVNRTRLTICATQRADVLHDPVFITDGMIVVVRGSVSNNRPRIVNCPRIACLPVESSKISHYSSAVTKSMSCPAWNVCRTNNRAPRINAQGEAIKSAKSSQVSHLAVAEHECMRWEVGTISDALTDNDPTVIYRVRISVQTKGSDICHCSAIVTKTVWVVRAAIADANNRPGIVNIVTNTVLSARQRANVDHRPAAVSKGVLSAIAQGESDNCPGRIDSVSSARTKIISDVLSLGRQHA